MIQRFKRQADDSLALNDRLKEKLVGMMEEHVNMVSNMTCVLKELNVIDHNNNVDLAALKEDSKQYKVINLLVFKRFYIESPDAQSVVRRQV